jgi:acyl-CoA thioester hydrolase
MPIATRWIDNDVYGHVNNVVYYAYFDTVINRFLIDEGGLDIGSGDVIGVCAESRCTYVRSAAFPDALEAGLRVVQIGTSSVTYEIGIFDSPEPLRGVGSQASLKALCASGHFVHVFVDRKTRKPTAIPAGIRTALERIHTPSRAASANVR